jgi:hypothetical protein
MLAVHSSGGLIRLRSKAGRSPLWASASHAGLPVASTAACRGRLLGLAASAPQPPPSSGSAAAAGPPSSWGSSAWMPWRAVSDAASSEAASSP